MKKQFKYILVGLGLVFLSACKRENLDPVPQTFIADVNAFDTPARIANQVNSMYAALKGGTFFGGRAQIAGDIRGEDFINETTNLVTGADVWALNATGTSANFVKNMWAQGYYVINLANLFIDGMAAKGTTIVGAALSANYIGEARLIRALAYYQLLQHYARPFADGNGNKPGLPLRLIGIKDPGFSPMARSTVAEVYAQIITDLNFAESNLPLTSGTAVLNTTRSHRNTAIALKTRVYLTMQNYASVITEANKIVSAAAPFTAPTGVAHALAADIVNVFRTPYTATESILSMPMTATAGDNPGTQNQLGYYYSKSTGNGEFSLNPAGIIADAGWTAADRRRSFNAVVSGKPYLNLKYNAPSPYTDYAPVMRYSEVLLNLAEALARTNGLDVRAIALLNAVRQRSDPATILAPATAAALIAAILQERRIEFLGEGLRNIDQMRLLQTIPAKGSAPAKSAGESGYIWPISADEMSLNPLMTDN